MDGTGYQRLVILASDYDYNFDQEYEARLATMKSRPNVQVVRRMIPPEIYEYLKKAKDKGDSEPLKD